MAYTGSKAFAGQGAALTMGNGASPEVFTKLAELKSIQRSGAKADQVDVTNMDSIGAYREYLATLLDAGEISFTGNYIPSDATQAALQTTFDARAVVNWKIVLPPAGTYIVSLGTWTFAAFVTAFDFDIPHDKEATISGKLKITGKPVFAVGS
jgi:predicted secreted protein